MLSLHTALVLIGGGDDEEYDPVLSYTDPSFYDDGFSLLAKKLTTTFTSHADEVSTYNTRRIMHIIHGPASDIGIS